MGRMVELTAADGHRLQAYRASPEGQPRGGLVMIQEIFGMTEQMQRCADRYAAEGYAVALPAMFDRVEPGLSFGYTEFQRGGQASQAITEENLLADAEASRLSVSDAGGTAIIGYCWGGTAAYIGACLGNFAAAICYYGGGIGSLVERMQPKAPVMYHFGAEDSYIPESTIEQIREADPSGIFHIYEGAGHGFNCDDRDSYDAESAKLSEKRSLEFLADKL